MNASPVQSSSAPPWLDRRLYPFENRWAEVRGARLHYVDEGAGPTLLMLHGNGSWTFGYRRLIPLLSKHFRCIAVDYAGFGLSQAASGFSFKPADHSLLIEAFIDHLELRDLRLFVQDWGGPIGLGLAGRRPALIHSLFISNTWAWPAQGTKHIERFARFASGPIGRFLILNFNFLMRVAVPKLAMFRKLTKAERDIYAAPYRTRASRRPQTIFPREILASRAYLEEVLTGLANLADKPTILLWGDSDNGFREGELHKMQQLFPRARTVVLNNARHFVQEDAPEELSRAMIDFDRHTQSDGRVATSPST